MAAAAELLGNSCWKRPGCFPGMKLLIRSYRKLFGSSQGSSSLLAAPRNSLGAFPAASKQLTLEAPSVLLLGAHVDTGKLLLRLLFIASFPDK